MKFYYYLPWYFFEPFSFVLTSNHMSWDLTIDYIIHRQLLWVKTWLFKKQSRMALVKLYPRRAHTTYPRSIGYSLAQSPDLLLRIPKLTF